MLLRSLVLFASLLLGAGCSALKLAYNNADELVYWSLNDHFDFDPAQGQLARGLLGQWHTRHRRETLPGYARFLRRIAERAPLSVDAGAVCALADEARGALADLTWQFQPLAQGLAPALSERQWEYLRQRFAEKNAEWSAEWIEREATARDAARLKRLRGNLERFYGTLSEPQLELLRAHIAALPFEAELLRGESLRRQTELLALLRQPGGGGATAWQGFFERMVRPPDATYQGYLERSRHALCETLAKLHQLAPVSQRERLAATLRDYADDLDALARQRRD